MKKLSILFSVLFAFQTAFGQWNAIGWNPYFVRSTEGDSTFVLSSPSRYDLQRGIANWTPASGASYKVYTALLTQSGTDAPVATVLENTLGGTVVWSYHDTGSYYATLSGAFTSNKTVAPGFPNTANSMSRIRFLESEADILVGFQVNSTSVIELSTSEDGTSPMDDKLTNFFFEVRVYP